MWILSISIVTKVFVFRTFGWVSQAWSNCNSFWWVWNGLFIWARCIGNGTRIRVLTGIKRWKENQEAMLIMSGFEYFEGRKNPRQSNLMTNMAVITGVPKYKIVVDTLSLNTFEHPQRILELPGISPQSLVEVVTSKWHMRRAIWCFQEFFTNV